MLLDRNLLTIWAVALGMSFFALPARAQQGYEFGIRFRPVTFQRQNFGGFNFQPASFRPQNLQPIQFNRITFPALNSRAVRRDAYRPRLLQPPVAPAFTAGTSLRDRQLQPVLSGGGQRVVLAAADLPGRLQVVHRSTEPSQSMRFSQTADPLRVARSVVRTAEARRRAGVIAVRYPASRVRREVIARRFDGVQSRGTQLAGGIRSARFAGRSLLVR